MHENRPWGADSALLRVVLITEMQNRPRGAECHQLCGSVTLSRKTSEEKLRYLWARGGTTTWGGGERQVDVIHRGSHQRPFDHVHVGDGEDALPRSPWDPPFVPVLVHLSKQRDPLTLQDTARPGSLSHRAAARLRPLPGPLLPCIIYYILCSEKPPLLDLDECLSLG